MLMILSMSKVILVILKLLTNMLLIELVGISWICYLVDPKFRESVLYKLSNIRDASILYFLKNYLPAMLM